MHPIHIPGLAEIREAHAFTRTASVETPLVLEPSGAVAIAALLQVGEAIRGKTALCYATGGNIAFTDFTRLV